MTSLNRTAGPAFFALMAIVGTSFGFVGQKIGDRDLRWATDLVRFTIQEAGDASISDGSDMLAVRLAFRAWEVRDSRLRFVEDTDAGQRARRDWRSDDVHLVVWDETNESGLFGSASGLVAVTPVDFDPRTGEILDADILLNGQRPFATTLDRGAFDVQSIVTHEVGHFLGLDHSPVEGSSMTPVTAPGDTRLRSLEADDLAGVVARYPAGAALGVLEGVVRRDGRAVSGAHVVAENELGEPAGSTLTDGRGGFQIVGLEAGSYAVYAEPLNGRVKGADLQLSTSGLRVDTAFGATFFGAGGRSSPAQPERVALSAGQRLRLSGIDTLPPNAMRAHHLWDERVTPGQSARLVVAGDALNGADALLVGARPNELALSGATFNAGTASATLDVSSYAATGLRTVRVFRRATWDCAILTGRLEVRGPAPTVAGLSALSAAPGDRVQVSGTFAPGARVLIGPAVAQSWASGAALWVEIPTIPNGTYALVVENPDGQAAVARGLEVKGSSVRPQPPVGATPPSAAAPAASSASSAGRPKGGSSSSGCTLGPSENDPFGALAIVALLLCVVALRRVE